MPNNGRRKTRIAAARAARKEAGINMFSPIVRVKSVEPNSSPLGAESMYGTAILRPANYFTGVPFTTALPLAERKQLELVGLSAPTLETGLDQNNIDEITRIAIENEANTQATKNASSLNNETDENIREQLGELNLSSTKSLSNDNRTAEIDWYRKNVLNRYKHNAQTWYSAINSATGRQFFYNPNGSSQWEPPILPEGWSSSINSATGKLYYYNANGSSQWKPPIVSNGWHSSINRATGKLYYYSDNGTTQWEYPMNSSGGRSRRKHSRKARR